MTLPQGTQKKPSALWMIGLLLLIIAIPMFIASFMVNHGKDNIQSNNQGNLLAIGNKNISTVTLHDIAKDNDIIGKTLVGKWWLVYVGPKHCQETCYDVLFNMRQIRAALGKNTARLERLYIANPACQDSPCEASINEKYPDMTQVRMQERDFTQLFGNVSDKENREMVGELYIIDPQGNIMMQYDVDMPAKAILSDLKRLLSVSQIG